MKIVVFGLTVSSSWGNGYATLWRGLIKALGRRGHRTVFFEHDAPYYAMNRDAIDLPGGELALYTDWAEARRRATRELGDADVAIVTSYCPDSIQATELVLDAPRAAPSDEPVIVGLPDTVWFPEDALRSLPDDALSFLLFPVERPELFDAVVLDGKDRVIEIQVKRPDASSIWVWGAFKMPGRVLRELKALWHRRACEDEYFGTLINAWLAAGGTALGVKAGRSYVDVGTLNGYRKAIGLLSATVVQCLAAGGDPLNEPSELLPEMEAPTA